MQLQARFGTNFWDRVKTGTRVSQPFQQKGPWKKTSSDQRSETEQGDGGAGAAEPAGRQLLLGRQQAVSFTRQTSSELFHFVFVFF